MTVEYPRFRNILAVTTAFVGIQLLLGILIGIIRILVSKATGIPVGSTFLNISYISAALLAYIIVLKRFHRKSRLDPGSFFRRDTLSPFLSAGFALVMMGFILLMCEMDNIMAEWKPMPSLFSSQLETMLAAPGILAFIQVVLMPALLEELLFRGYFLQGLKGTCTAGKAVVGTALLFGLIHINPWQMVSAVPLGLVFGWFAWKTGSIILPLFGHALNNLLYLVSYKYARYFAPLGVVQMQGEDIVHLSPALLLAGAAAAAAGGWIVLHALRGQQTPLPRRIPRDPEALPPDVPVGTAGPSESRSPLDGEGPVE